MKLHFLLSSMHGVIHDWLINDGGSMTLWKITAKIEPKLEHYVGNWRLDNDVKCIKWVKFSSRIDILRWRVKEMSFSPKNEVLAFRAPLGRSEERCGVDCESTRQVWQKWRARTLRPMLGCSDIGTLGAALGRFETTIFLPEFEYNSQWPFVSSPWALRGFSKRWDATWKVFFLQQLWPLRRGMSWPINLMISAVFKTTFSTHFLFSLILQLS